MNYQIRLKNQQFFTVSNGSAVAYESRAPDGKTLLTTIFPTGEYQLESVQHLTLLAGKADYSVGARFELLPANQRVDLPQLKEIYIRSAGIIVVILGLAAAGVRGGPVIPTNGPRLPLELVVIEGPQSLIAPEVQGQFHIHNL